MGVPMDRRAVLAMGAAAVGGGLWPGQPGGPGKDGGGKEKKEKAAPEPVTVGVKEAPRMLVYSSPTGQVMAPRGVLAAVWADGRVVRCKDEAAPGKDLLAGSIAPGLVWFGEEMMEAIGVRRDELQHERNVMLDSNYHAVCVMKDEKVSRMCCTLWPREGLDDFFVRYWAARDLILRLAMSAEAPVKNAETLNAAAGALAHRKVWEPV